MKRLSLMVLTVVLSSTFLSSTFAFAESSSSTNSQSNVYQNKKGGYFQTGAVHNGVNGVAQLNGRNARGTQQFVKKGFDKNVDPNTMSENQKTNLQKRVEAGKMIQADADRMIAQIQQRINDKQAFDALTLQEKKDKLLSDFTQRINQSVMDKKMAQDKADKAIADYKAKLDKWDGTGNIPFGGMMGFGFQQIYNKNGMKPGMKPNEGNKFGKKGFDKNVDPNTMLQSQKANLQKRVDAGKMSQADADKMIAQMQQRINDQQAFNALTPQEKKDKLSADFTNRTNQSVTNKKMTQEKADKAIADYKAKLTEWDGTGMIPFGARVFGHKN